MPAHTIATAITSAKQLLKHDMAVHDGRAILAHILDKDLSYLIAYAEQALTAEQQQQFTALLARLQNGEPLAYLLGYQDFWDIRLSVNPSVLIPRPDTETLIECVLAHSDASACSRILDLGTGSGAIALALKSARRFDQIVALDRSSAAISTAQQNARQLKLDINLIQGSWLDAIGANQFDVIVANPPYIASNDPHLADLSHEPVQALVAEENGLADYRRIIQQAGRVLRNNGLLAFEHGYQQAEAVCQLLHQAGFIAVNTLHDLAGHPRVSFGHWESGNAN
ncbi:MAG: peptide chain release factor N(5)-glutamine methyltransferase [Pseudomonadales bacterium]|nr:peptide chain release factor N(5)-glutamine methyltransferase [Pseudomonadales bacterium]